MDKQDEMVNEAKKYVIFVGKIKLTFSDPKVKASQLLSEYSDGDLSELILVATQGRSGKAVEEYQSTDTVDLSKKHHKHFRVEANGGGRA